MRIPGSSPEGKICFWNLRLTQWSLEKQFLSSAKQSGRSNRLPGHLAICNSACWTTASMNEQKRGEKQTTVLLSAVELLSRQMTERQMAVVKTNDCSEDT